VTVAKAKIDLANRLIELEGPTEFVSEHLAKLEDVLKNIHQIKEINANSEIIENPKIEIFNSKTSDETAVSTKKKKKVPKRPAGAKSCRVLLLELRSNKFFNQQRTPKDIVTGLLEKGFRHTENQISAALSIMFSKGEIKRQNPDGEGWKYHWDYPV
jgi:hypothetical protein